MRRASLSLWISIGRCSVRPLRTGHGKLLPAGGNSIDWVIYPVNRFYDIFLSTGLVLNMSRSSPWTSSTPRSARACARPQNPQAHPGPGRRDRLHRRFLLRPTGARGLYPSVRPCWPSRGPPRHPSTSYPGPRTTRTRPERAIANMLSRIGPRTDMAVGVVSACSPLPQARLRPLELI